MLKVPVDGNFCRGLTIKRDTKWVSNEVESSMRIELLSWNHHQVVAPLEPDDQDDWLDRASWWGCPVTGWWAAAGCQLWRHPYPLGAPAGGGTSPYIGLHGEFFQPSRGSSGGAHETMRNTRNPQFMEAGGEMEKTSQTVQVGQAVLLAGACRVVWEPEG